MPSGPSCLETGRAGGRLQAGDLERLYHDTELIALGQAAHEVRLRSAEPAVVTYIIDRNINYTNVCVYGCRFCAFHRGADDLDAYVLSLEAIDAKVAETVTAGGTGILLQGGVNPSLRLEFFEELLRHLRSVFPHLHIHGLSAPEVWFLAKREKRPLRQVLERLVAAGLGSLPGGGAEVLDDPTRERVGSGAKASTEEWLQVHREAHRVGLRTTATMMFGVGEPVAARIRHLLAVRRLQDETGGFTAFIPWTFQERNTELEGRVPVAGGDDYLRTLALSRIALDNIDHVQGSWVTQGPKMGQLSLFFGADDLGSVMLEENVVAAAGTQHRMSQRDMERLIRGAGFRPRQRRTLYEPL